MKGYKRVTTARHTLKTASSPDGMVKFGNKGGTKETTLPKGGQPTHRKKKAPY